MNLEKLDGYEFEKLISELVKKMGFIVEQTSLSGDGGVDIIADNTSPIFKGRYLIQCKRWSNTIGEPVVRDLFGVVLAQNANKGIIITNSFFSDRAKKFADGKNIELIDGNLLNSLLKEYNILPEQMMKYNEKEMFYEMANFERDKYLYIKNRIAENKGEKQYYDMMHQFYNSYAFSGNYELNKKGLFDEYITFNELIIDKFCRKGKYGTEEKKSIQYINGFLYLFKGHIFKSIEIFKDLGYFDEMHVLRMLPTQYKLQFEMDPLRERIVMETHNPSKYVIIKNLYLVFQWLNFKHGLDYLENLYENARSNFFVNTNYSGMNNDILDFELVGKLFNCSIRPLYDVANHYTIKHIDSVFIDIRNNKYEKFHVPLDYNIDKGYHGSGYFYNIMYSENKYLPIQGIINNYIRNEEVNEQLEKVTFLLNI